MLKLNAEQILFNNEHLSDDEELVQEKWVLGNTDDTFSYEDLQGHILKDEIKKDQLYVKKIKKFDAKFLQTERGAMFQKILVRLVNDYAWLGDCAVANNTTEYDDRVNSTDIAVEIGGNEGEETVKIAIDVSVCDDENTLMKKANRMRKELDDMRGTTIKYFVSDFGEERGRITNIPRVVLMINKETLGNLCSVVASNVRGDLSSKDLADHEFKNEIISNIIEQLEEHKKYLEKLFKKYHSEDWQEQSKRNGFYINTVSAIRTLNQIQNQIEKPASKKGKAGLGEVIYPSF